MRDGYVMERRALKGLLLSIHGMADRASLVGSGVVVACSVALSALAYRKVNNDIEAHKKKVRKRTLKIERRGRQLKAQLPVKCHDAIVRLLAGSEVTTEDMKVRRFLDTLHVEKLELVKDRLLSSLFLIVYRCAKVNLQKYPDDLLSAWELLQHNSENLSGTTLQVIDFYGAWLSQRMKDPKKMTLVFERELRTVLEGGTTLPYLRQWYNLATNLGRFKDITLLGTLMLMVNKDFFEILRQRQRGTMAANPGSLYTIAQSLSNTHNIDLEHLKFESRPVSKLRIRLMRVTGHANAALIEENPTMKDVDLKSNEHIMLITGCVGRIRGFFTANIILGGFLFENSTRIHLEGSEILVYENNIRSKQTESLILKFNAESKIWEGTYKIQSVTIPRSTYTTDDNTEPKANARPTGVTIEEIADDNEPSESKQEPPKSKQEPPESKQEPSEPQQELNANSTNNPEQTASEEQEQTASEEQEQTASKEQEQTDSKEQEQTDSKEQEQADSKEQEQTASKEQEQTASKEQEQTDSKEQEQTDSKEQEQTASEEQEPTASKEPNNTDDEKANFSLEYDVELEFNAAVPDDESPKDLLTTHHDHIKLLADSFKNLI